MAATLWLVGCAALSPQASYDAAFNAAFRRCEAMSDLDPAKGPCLDRLNRDVLAGDYSAPMPEPVAFQAPLPAPRAPVAPSLVAPPSYSFPAPVMPVQPAGRATSSAPPFCGLGSGADQISGICR